MKYQYLEFWLQEIVSVFNASRTIKKTSINCFFPKQDEEKYQIVMLFTQNSLQILSMLLLQLSEDPDMGLRAIQL